MAGVAGSLPRQPVTTGAFGRLARAQYAALAGMRWSMFRNSVRSTQGAIELGARAVSFLVYSVMGVGLAFGLGAGAFQIASRGRWEFLPLLFWIVFLLWQTVPITLASFQQQFEMGGLLRFPLGFGSFYVLHLVFGLIDASTIMGACCCVGLWLGIAVARPDLGGWTALALLVFAAFNVLLVRAIFAWIERWLAQRRTREIVSVLFLLFVLAINFLNPAFRAQRRMSAATRAETMRWIHRAQAAQQWLPPGLAERIIAQPAQGSPMGWIEALALLAAYTGATAATLGVRLHAEFRGESFGDAPARNQAPSRAGTYLLDGSGPIAAVVEKEIRTITRAMPLLYALGAPLLMVFLFAGLFRRSTGSAPHFSWGLLVCLAYAVVGFTQLLYNNLGAEGAGIQVLFLSPTPIRTVILAKNLFHAALFVVDAALVTLLVGIRYGALTPAVLAATWAWVAFALPVHLAAGNIFSIVMPYRLNLGRIGRQKGSQSNALLSMVVQAAVLGVGALVLFLCTLRAELWIAIPIFLIMAAAAVVVWLRVLGRVDAMAYARREELVAALVRTE